MAASGELTWAQLVSSFDVSPTATVLHGRDGRIVAVNRAAEALLGRDAAELVGQRALEPDWGVVHPDGTPVTDRDVPALRALDSGRAGEPRTLGMRRAGGDLVWIQVTTRPLGSGGRPTGVAVFLEDVTDVRAVHDRLERSEQRMHHRLQELLEAMTDAYYAIDDRWRVTYVNARAAELLGRAPEDMLGRSLRELFPEAVGGDIEARYREVQATGEPVTFESYYDPHERWYELRVYPAAGGLAVHFRDVSDRHHADVEREQLLAATSAALAQAQSSRAELERAALHDPTTGLPNRTGFLHWAETGARERRRSGAAGRSELGVLLIDLDRFRHVNDVHGHGEGDRLLHQVADRLRQTLDDRVFLGRLSGDEFLVAVRDVAVDELLGLADLVLRTLRRPFPTAGQMVVVTGTIGAAFAAEGHGTEALRDADSALSRAKDAGGDRVALFDEERRRQTVDRLRLETDLRFALEQRQLHLHHQAFYSLTTGHCGGSEALLRWTHPTLGPVPPDRFIPLAEETGLIVPVGDLVLEETVRLAAAPSGPPGSVWCNVSGRQLERPGFTDRVLAELEGARVPPRRFGIEVTESVLIEDRPEVADALTSLSEGGVLIAVDDFGTGYSSLARLSTYPVDLLKIDRSFVAGLPDRSRALVAAITDLGHALGVAVCAEGVETWEQLDVLRELGVDQACGFLLARPVPTESLTQAARAGQTTLLTAV